MPSCSDGRWRRGNVERRGPRLQHVVVGDDSMGEKDPLLARLLAAATAGAPPQTMGGGVDWLN